MHTFALKHDKALTDSAAQRLDAQSHVKSAELSTPFNNVNANRRKHGQNGLAKRALGLELTRSIVQRHTQDLLTTMVVVVSKRRNGNICNRWTCCDKTFDFITPTAVANAMGGVCGIEVSFSKLATKLLSITTFLNWLWPRIFNAPLNFLYLSSIPATPFVT